MDLHLVPVRNDYFAIVGGLTIFAVTLLIAYAGCWSRLLAATVERVAIEQLQEELRPRIMKAHQVSHLVTGVWIGAVAGFSIPAIVGYLISVELLLWGVPRLIPGPRLTGPHKLQRVIYVLPILIGGVIVATLIRMLRIKETF